MTAFLLDEMFPPAAAALLRERYGHDALHVCEAGLQGADDAQVAAAVRAEGRVMVTENVVDFSADGVDQGDGTPGAPTRPTTGSFAA